jgi:sorting nexin-7/30/sorting nexin-8
MQPNIQQNLNETKLIQNQPQMQNKFPQPFFNQFPNYANSPLQQNQFNQQFQPQLMQGQFPKLLIPNQQNNFPNMQNIQNIQNINNNQQNQQKINTEIKTAIPQNQIQTPKNEQIKPIPENQNKIPNPVKNPTESGKPNSKDDIGILYGIISDPTDESRFVDKTPLGIADNPTIQVGFPEKVEGGFFSKSYVTYLVTTIPLNIKVRRRYSDFDWLRQILSNLYVGNVIPTTPRKNKLGSDKFGDAFLQKRMRTLEKFLNSLLMNPIIKYSQLFYDFISIENEADFNKKKKEYEKAKPPQTINENQSLIGRINIEVKKEKEIFFENIKDNITFNEALLTKLNENFKLLKQQIENITLKIDEIAQNWNDLCKTSTKYFDGDDIIQTYEYMGKLFTNWSDALKRHNNVIHIDIREYFKYVKNTFKSMKDVVSVVETSKNTFNKNERYLINKKEDLFRKGDVNKWELDINERDNANKLLQDKNAALMKIIPKETNNVIYLKKTYGYYLNRIIDEYERIKSINSILHKKNLVNACEKITEIYGDFQKGTADIINFFNMKEKAIQNTANVNNIKV